MPKAPKVSAIFFYGLLSFFVLCLAINVLPSESSLDKNVKPLIDKAIRSIGLWQKWNMFSPNPTREDVTMYAKVTLKNGTIKQWTPIRMSELSLTDKYIRERWRKWGMDNIRADSHSALWPSLGRYIEKSYDAHFPDQQIDKIEIYRTWYTVPYLEARFIERDQIRLEPRKDFLFYTYQPGIRTTEPHR